MEREIKFRALSNMNKWHYGYYLFVKNSPVNGKEINQHTIHNGNYQELIKPETVGQFTGLQDLLENDIYEGDILKYGVMAKGIVSYERDRFICNMVYNDKQEITFHLINVFNITEIIGNIHENKNLL